MTPLVIKAFFDNRLGHEKQTQGILSALAALTQVSVHPLRLPAPDFTTGLKNWGRFLGTRLFPLPPEKSAAQVDLIIGTGASTHIPMLLYQEQCGARLITCMTPDWILRNKMDLCFVPRHDSPRPAANIFVTLGPPNTAVFQNRHDPDKGLILVGGLDPKSHHWDSARTLGWIQQLIDAAPDKSWTISSSPRTPADMVQLLQAHVAGTARVVFFKAKDTGPGWIEAAYADHQSVWVTADSVSMIYEALSAGCRVGILPVQWKRKVNKFQKSIDYLLQEQRVITMDMWQAGQSLPQAAPLNEAARCASEILRRWWPDRLYGNP